MKTKRIIVFLLIGAIMMLGAFGCGKQKYKLNFDGSFESEKTEYAEGEKVTVRYDIIATDTDYHFWIDDDVDMKQDYDGGYVFTFTMPAHDVTIHEESYNSMVYDPYAGIDDLSEEFNEEDWIFDYYDAVAVTGEGEGDGYNEMVLYERKEGEGLILARYSKWGGGDESSDFCIVPESVFDDCMAVVEEYDMKNWKDGFPIDGVYMVVKFKEDDEVTRISSDAMPSDGEAAFSAVGAALGAAWSEYAP